MSKEFRKQIKDLRPKDREDVQELVSLAGNVYRDFIFFATEGSDKDGGLTVVATPMNKELSKQDAKIERIGDLVGMVYCLLETFLEAEKYDMDVNDLLSRMAFVSLLHKDNLKHIKKGYKVSKVRRPHGKARH